MLRGEKVILRAIERDDLKQLHDLEQHVDLVVLADGHWWPYSLGAMEKRWEKQLEERDNPFFAIVADDKPIGSCGLHHIERRDRTAAVGIGIYDPAYISKGYGRDALNLLVDWSFRIENYRRLWLDTLITNQRAVRSYLACGFVQEGLLRQHYYASGEYHDAVVMGLMRTEWEDRRTAASASQPA